MESTLETIAILKEEGFTDETIKSLADGTASRIVIQRASKAIVKHHNEENRKARDYEKALDAPVPMRHFIEVMKNLEVNMNKLILAYEALLYTGTLTGKDLEIARDVMSARESINLCYKCQRTKPTYGLSQRPSSITHCMGVKTLTAEEVWPELDFDNLATRIVRCTGYKQKDLP